MGQHDEGSLGDGRGLLDALPERIFVCKRDGALLSVNPTARALLGRSSDCLEGLSILDLIPPQFHTVEGQPLLEHMLSLTKGKSLRAALVHRRGVHIDVDLTAASWVSGGGNARVLVVARQVPEKEIPNRAEADKVNTETHRLVFEGAPVGIFHFDARGVITACNGPFVEIIGSSKSVLVGLNMTTLPFKPIAEAVEQALQGAPSQFEGAYPSATSDKLTQVRVQFAPIVDGAAVIGGVGIAEDFTERVLAEQALRRSFESLRTVIDHAPDGIAVLRSNRFLLVNPSLVAMLGYTNADELLATPMLDVVYAADHPTTELRVAIVEQGARVPSRDLRLLRKDGSTVRTEVASMSVHFEDGPAILTLIRDVSARKVLEARLAQADRMASIGTLAVGVAHEINNPLTYVLGNLDLLELNLGAQEWPTDSGRRTPLKMVRDARDGCERVRRIVKDLRAFTRAESDTQGRVDLHRVIESAINVASVEIRHRARLERCLEAVPPLVGDQHRLGQVVLNLLLNAAQAIPKGSPREHTIRVHTHLKDDSVELSVEDDGDGIPPEVLGHLFEPFFTTKPTGVGTGLGLSICQGIVQAHGGSIRVESEVGKGSKFRVLLPANRAEKPAPRLKAAVPLPEVSGASILIIDDEPQLGVALRSLLQPHEIVLANSGREGLQVLQEGYDPDLILCDLMMPDVSGLGVFEALRRERPELCSRFVFMTGGIFPDKTLELLAGSGALRLHKPFGRADIERVLVDVQRAHGGKARATQ